MSGSTTTAVRTWPTGLSWTAGNDVSLKLTAPGAPSPPTSLTAAADGPTEIDLSWTAPTSDGGSGITGYKIEVSDDGGTNYSDLVPDTGTTDITYSHTGLASNTTRHYRVSAINAIGTGPASNVATVTTSAGPPRKPTGLMVTEGHRAVKLDWTAPADDGGSPITGYEYTPEAVLLTPVVATGNTSPTHIVDNLADNNYLFVVRAVNAIGPGPWSSNADAAIGTIGPATVTIAGDGGVTEGAAASFTLRASKPVLSSAKPLNVRVSVSESEDMVASAQEGTKTVSFAMGDTTARLSVPTVDDGATESDSVVTAAIQTNSDYTVGTDSSATVTVSDAAPGSPTNRAALVALYDATGGADWTNKTNWKSSAALSTWHGVITDFDGRVTQLYLGDNNLSGVIPTELGNLTNLRTLHLYGNSFLGRDLPLGLMNLNALTSVWIQRTGLCPPDDAAFLAWVAALDDFGGCTEPHTAPVVLSVATKSSGGDWIILTLSKALSRILVRAVRLRHSGT